MARGLLEDRAELEALFDELSRELIALGTTAHIVMVGGAWMLWHSERRSTRDIDSARKLGSDLAAAVEKIAERHDLSRQWLSDSAAPFWPATADYEDCEIVYQQPAVEVRVPGPEVIFVMKLYRADPQDREDLISLWPLCDFTNPQAAAQAFQDAYPHAPVDDFLSDYIADVAHEAAP